MTTAIALDWRTRARCKLNPDLFTTRTATAVNLALHICRTHCPVRQECHDEAVELPVFLRHEVVLGGVAYASNGRPASRQNASQRCPACPAQRRRRREDEGLTEAEMIAERDLDEREADR